MRNKDVSNINFVVYEIYTIKNSVKEKDLNIKLFMLLCEMACIQNGGIIIIIITITVYWTLYTCTCTITS